MFEHWRATSCECSIQLRCVFSKPKCWNIPFLYQKILPVIAKKTGMIQSSTKEDGRHLSQRGAGVSRVHQRFWLGYQRKNRCFKSQKDTHKIPLSFGIVCGVLRTNVSKKIEWNLFFPSPKLQNSKCLSQATRRYPLWTRCERGILSGEQSVMPDPFTRGLAQMCSSWLQGFWVDRLVLMVAVMVARRYLEIWMTRLLFFDHVRLWLSFGQLI